MNEVNPDISELLKKPYMVDVTAQTQLVKKDNVTPITTNVKFVDIAKNYWTIKGKGELYNKGAMIGNAITSQPNFDEFLKQFSKVFEECIRYKLSAANKTSENYQADFRTLFYLFNMICIHLKNETINMNDESFVAVMHGFMDSYVTKTTGNG